MVNITDIVEGVRLWFPDASLADTFWIPRLLFGGDGEGNPARASRIGETTPGEVIQPVGGIEPVIGAINSISVVGDVMEVFFLDGYNEYRWECNGFANTWRYTMTPHRGGHVTIFNTLFSGAYFGGWEVFQISTGECQTALWINIRTYYEECDWYYTTFRSSLPTVWKIVLPFQFYGENDWHSGTPINLSALVQDASDTSDRGMLWGYARNRRYTYTCVRLRKQAWTFTPPAQTGGYLPPPIAPGITLPFLLGGSMIQSVNLMANLLIQKAGAYRKKKERQHE